MRITLIFIFSLSLLFSCSEDRSSILQFKWIEGNWEGHPDDSTTLFENWKIVDDTRLTGSGGMLINSDTVFKENISIIQKDDHFYYHVELAENKTPVDFLFDDQQKDSAIFVNKEHDFPQRIVYHYKKQGVLNAFIDGNNKGTYRKEIFDYQRKQTK